MRLEVRSQEARAGSQKLTRIQDRVCEEDGHCGEAQMPNQTINLLKTDERDKKQSRNVSENKEVLNM
jgi:hypothetical protein